MYNYFYTYFKAPLAFDLFSRNSQDGTPSPPASERIISEDGIFIISENNNQLITE